MSDATASSSTFSPFPSAAAPPGNDTRRDEHQAELARALRAQLALLTGGLAPDDYVEAWWNWYLNLAREPSVQGNLLKHAWEQVADNVNFAWRAALAGEPVAPKASGGPFVGEAWAQWPFNVYAHAYSNTVEFWNRALAAVPGLKPEQERTLDFASRTALEAFSPAHYLTTNPELIEATRAEAGQNLVRGLGFWLEDMRRTLGAQAKEEPERFVVGRDVAASPGKVILRNELMELIQYSPTTESVYAEPILIVPAWIMKYYILDLSPANSMVRYLVSQGHTVFMVSWKNPTAADRNLGMDDYLALGVRAAVDAVSRVVPERPMHAVGYCIGGTLLSIAAARYAAQGDQRLASVTLLAAQQDFSEAGELSVFISPRQLDMLEAVMNRAGVLESRQMGGAFALLRSRDLLWTPAVNTYVRGKREAQNDLMAWNADGTRMPCRMHSEYLRGLYLNNALARGQFEAEGARVDLAAIRLPMFVVGTETDHVAPWKSVYKARALTRSSDYTFLLTSGGHNAGIVSGPAHPRRRHRVHTWYDDHGTLPPDQWLEANAPKPGSWWPTWQAWLAEHSSARRVAPPGLGAAEAGLEPLADAPGEYVLRR